MNFADIVGQRHMIERMMRSVQTGRIVHAQLFEGPRGTGKKTVAEICARALNCHGEGQKPCDRCAYCLRFLSGNAPDVIRLKTEKSIGVDQIRELIEQVSRKTYEGGYRTVLIENADRMTPQAQNALLKTLETPPEQVIFFLISESLSAMLPTIISRCRVFHFECLSTEEVYQALTKQGIEPLRAQRLAEISLGSIGRALEIDRNEGVFDIRSRAIDAVESIRLPADVARAFQTLKDDKENADEILCALEIWARDRMAVQAGQMPFEKSDQTRLAQSRLDGVKLLTGVIETRKKLKSNVQWQSAMEIMLFDLI